MFCGYCGKELENGADFCPYCGGKLGMDGAGRSENQEPVKNDDDVLANERKSDGLTSDRSGAGNRKYVKMILAPVILVICLIAGYFGYQKIVEEKITSEIENTLELVKNGVSPEQADQILVSVVPELVGSEMLSNFILNNVSGEDVMDVYQSMMRYMSYEVIDVQKVESDHYQAIVRIDNLNNALVASYAFEILKARYTSDDFLGNIGRVIGDIGSDKSQIIAEVMTQAADACCGSGDSSYWISQQYTIDIVKYEGEWVPEGNLQSFACACLGLNL